MNLFQWICLYGFQSVFFTCPPKESVAFSLRKTMS